MQRFVCSLCALLLGALFSFSAVAQSVGYSWLGRCYSDSASVEQAACDAANGPNQYGLVQCVSVTELGTDSGGVTFKLSVQVPTSTTTTANRYYTFYQPVCDPSVSQTEFPWSLSISDGEAIATSILGALAAVWAVKLLARAASSSGSSESE